MQALEKARIRDCTCPGSPHEDGDFVYLSPTLPLRGGLIAHDQAVARASEVALGKANNLQYDWLETFVRYGATGWNLVDQDGEDIPFDVDVVLADYSMARPVAEKANELGYGDAAMAPFLPKNRTKLNGATKRPPKPSRTGRTPVMTSPPVTPTTVPSELP